MDKTIFNKSSVRRSLKSVPVLIAAALLCGTAPASAQSTATTSSAWTYEITPYFWGSAMKGDTQTCQLPTSSVDMSFSDILDTLDFGLMGAFEARTGRWGIFLDAIYMKVSDSATINRTGAGPLGATLSVTGNLRFEQTMLAGAVMYRAVEGTSPIDILGGLRYNKLDVEATADFSLLGLAGSRTRGGDKDWVDPYVGVRIQHPIANRWTLVGYADIGGFGVGSDFAWQAAVGVNYDFSKTVSAKFGYRYMDVDYDKSGFIYDMRIDGLFLGVGIRF